MVEKTNPNDTYIDEKEASRITGLALSTLRNLRARRRGPSYFKIGRSVRYSLADINAFMRSHRIAIESR
jgi:predicted DNA-binding transcriptional regulator AlpA